MIGCLSSGFVGREKGIQNNYQNCLSKCINVSAPKKITFQNHVCSMECMLPYISLLLFSLGESMNEGFCFSRSFHPYSCICLAECCLSTAESSLLPDLVYL